MYGVRGRLCIVALSIGIFSAIGARKVYIYDNWLHNFNKSSRIKLADKAICEHLAGAMAMHLEIDTGTDGGLKDPNVLANMSDFQNEIEKHPNVTKTFSIAEIITRVHEIMKDGKEIDLSKSILGQYYFLLEGSSYEDFWDFDYRRGRVTVFVLKPEYKEGEDIDLLIETKASECLGNATVSLGGDYMLCAHWVWLVAHEHLRSLAIAGVVVVMITSICLGSFRRGLIVESPVVFAVLMMFGILGFTGIPLGVATSMFGSIVLGLGIDYSIHFEHEYHAHGNVLDKKERVGHSFRSAGQACFWDFVVVSTSFSVLMLSSMPPIRKLGFMVGCTILVSIISTFLLEPSLFSFTNLGPPKVSLIFSDKYHKRSISNGKGQQ